jgi:hypothetical protein
MVDSKNSEKTLPAAEWEKFLRVAQVRVSELDACKSERAKAIRIGKLLAPMVGVVVPIQVKGRTGRAKLVLIEGRGREKRYGLSIRWDRDETMVDATNTTAVTDKVKMPTPTPNSGKTAVRRAVSKKSATTKGTGSTLVGAAGPVKSSPANAPANNIATNVAGGNSEDWGDE